MVLPQGKKNQNEVLDSANSTSISHEWDENVEIKKELPRVLNQYSDIYFLLLRPILSVYVHGYENKSLMI